jgi:hypothetical protein
MSGEKNLEVVRGIVPADSSKRYVRRRTNQTHLVYGRVHKDLKDSRKKET